MGRPEGDLSANRIGVYLECPAVYDRVYHQKQRSRPANLAALVRGGLVHRVLYAVTLPRLAPSGVPKRVDAVELERELLAQVGRSESPLTRASLDEARVCLAASAPIDLSRAVSAECSFALPAWESGPVVVGVLDREDEVEPGWFDVVDYKTGRDDGTELEDDPQALVYLWAVRRLRPEARRIRFRLRYLGQPYDPEPVEWSPDLDARAGGLLRWAWNRLNPAGREAALREGWLDPNPDTGDCASCAWRNECPAYGRRLRLATIEAADSAVDPRGLSTDALVLERIRRAADAKAVEGRRLELDRELVRRLDGRRTLLAAGARVTRVQPVVRTWPGELGAIRALRAAEPGANEDVLRGECSEVTPKGVERYLATRLPEVAAEARAALKAAYHHAPGSAYPRVTPNARTPWTEPENEEKNRG